MGLLLAYTPLHHLLLSPVSGARASPQPALVMTSGNLSDEPICYDDADARAGSRASPTHGSSTTARSTCHATIR